MLGQMNRQKSVGAGSMDLSLLLQKKESQIYNFFKSFPFFFLIKKFYFYKLIEYTKKSNLTKIFLETFQES